MIGMGDQSSRGWDRLAVVHNFHGAVRRFGSGKGELREYEYEEEEIVDRGLQKKRKHKPVTDPRRPTEDRPALGYPHQHLSDPGPQYDYQNAIQPPAQQHQGQYTGDSSMRQGYYQGQSNPMYQPSLSNSYGQNLQSSTSAPPSSYANSSSNQGHQPQSTYPGRPFRPGSHDSQYFTSSPTSYGHESAQSGFGSRVPNGNSYNDTPPNRIASAPIVYTCRYNRADYGS